MGVSVRQSAGLLSRARLREEKSWRGLPAFQALSTFRSPLFKMVASRAIGSLSRFTASRTLRCPGEAWLRAPRSPWHNSCGDWGATSDPRLPLAAAFLSPPGSPALNRGEGCCPETRVLVKKTLSLPLSRLPSPAAVSDSLTPNVPESCPPARHFSRVSSSHFWARAPLTFFNAGLGPSPTRSGVAGLTQYSLSHLYGSAAACP